MSIAQHRQGSVSRPNSLAWILSGDRAAGRPYTVADSSLVEERYSDTGAFLDAVLHGETIAGALAIADRALTNTTRGAIESSQHDYVGVNGRAGACIPDFIAPCFSSTRGLIHDQIDQRANAKRAREAAMVGVGYSRKPETVGGHSELETICLDTYTRKGCSAGYYRRMTLAERTTGHRDRIAPLYARYADGTYYLVKLGNRPEIVAQARTMYDWHNTPNRTPRGQRGAGSKERRNAARAAKRAAWQAAQQRLADGFIVQNNNN